VPIDLTQLPEDPQMLQRMVRDLSAQLDRESAERHKIESLLREFLQGKRGRKSEQLSDEQLALFAAAWEAHEAATAQAESAENSEDDRQKTDAGANASAPRKRGGAGSLWRGI
jgi:hypothetical protein